MSDITAGNSSYSAVISGCLDPGFDGASESIDTLPPVGSSDMPPPAKKVAAKPKG
jgi:hypothetical protein